MKNMQTLIPTITPMALPEFRVSALSFGPADKFFYIILSLDGGPYGALVMQDDDGFNKVFESESLARDYAIENCKVFKVIPVKAVELPT